jgi:hypothetical protein
MKEVKKEHDDIQDTWSASEGVASNTTKRCVTLYLFCASCG